MLVVSPTLGAAPPNEPDLWPALLPVLGSDDEHFGPARYNADFYVFCLQTCKDAAVWDALDCGQWRFWALQQKQLVDSKSRTLTQAGLVRLAALAFDFPQPMRAR